MNIFYIDKDPVFAAKQLCDKHIVKMQIESAQMLCTAHWENGGSAPYKRAHVNHPSTKWTRESIQHYRWLVDHGIGICEEYSRRYKKEHKTLSVLRWLMNNEPNIPDLGFKDPPQCMPEEYRRENAIEAYKLFYAKDKVNIKKLDWKKINNQPEWVNYYLYYYAK